MTAIGKKISIVVLTLWITSSAAFADSFGLPNFTVFGTQSVTINDSLDENTVCVNGNVGTGGTGAGALSLDKCRVSGNVSVTTAPVLLFGSHGAFSGSEILGSLGSVATTMSSVSNHLGGLTANQTLSSLILGTGSTTTFTNSSLTGGAYVVDINGNFNLNGSTLNLIASNPGDTFVINIAGTFGFSQSVINLSGVTSGQVIFNITDACGLAEVNKGTSVWNGTILAPGCDVRAHNSMDFSGALFGQNVTVDSGIVLKASTPGPTPVPEPGTLALFATGLFGVALRAFRRKS